ncbi:ribonuclease H-like domain-containing protein [Tanacetum coccineum]
MAEQDIPPPIITAMKIPIIRKGEYDIWSMRKAPIYIPKSMGCYCHEIRRRIMHQQLEKLLLLLLLRLPNNWLQEGIRKELKASCVSNPDELTPRKNVLKHQFENFSTASNESLDKAYDRFPETEVQLEFMVFRFPTLLLRNLLFTPPLKILTVFKEVSDASGDFRTGRNIDFKEKRHVSLDKSKIECYNCHRKGHFARECRSGRSQERRSYGDNGRSNAPTNESSSQALVAQDGLGGYNWSNDFDVEPVNYALMAISSFCSSSSSDSEGNPDILLQDRTVVDSGCSSHMTGNKAYISNYEDFQWSLIDGFWK